MENIPSVSIVFISMSIGFPMQRFIYSFTVKITQVKNKYIQDELEEIIIFK